MSDISAYDDQNDQPPLPGGSSKKAPAAKKPRKGPQGTAVGANSNFEQLVKMARNAVDRAGEFALKLDGQVYEIMPALLRLYLAGAAEPQKYQDFLAAQRVNVTKAKNNFYALVIALVPLEKRSDYRARLSLYAQCLHVLHAKGLKPEEVSAWMQKDELVDTKFMSGLMKAVRIYRNLPEIKAAKNTKKNDGQDTKADVLNEMLAKPRTFLDADPILEQLILDADPILEKLTASGPVALLGTIEGGRLKVSQVITKLDGVLRVMAAGKSPKIKKGKQKLEVVTEPEADHSPDPDGSDEDDSREVIVTSDGNQTSSEEANAQEIEH
ncbi:MAG: hypothetical protein JWN34_2151 [Bryobacterales bacterium]|nr:hypothetical protein [Bryobacterales bacterium]